MVAGESAVPPQQISSQWLLEVVRETLRAHKGAIYVVGKTGAEQGRPLYSARAAATLPARAEEQFISELRCGQEFCVFGITMERGGIYDLDGMDGTNSVDGIHSIADGSSEYRQVVLAAGLDENQWRLAIAATVRDLYR